MITRAPHTADIGVIGGTGLYRLLDDATELTVDTPYGAPSDRLTVAEIAGRHVAFLPRHGRKHSYPPHAINYRANIWALRSLGVRQILAPCAVGSLTSVHQPGAVVVPDQVVDRTNGRRCTYFDDAGIHVAFADPYCPAGRAALIATASEQGMQPADGGTMVVIDGPRFSSRAESRWYSAQGWSLINMTGLPEAALARELAVCYTAIAIVTDLDAGADATSAVSQQAVMQAFANNLDRLRTLLHAAVPALPQARSCPCADAHDGLDIPLATAD